MAKEILCGFGIDVDAVAGWLGSYGGEDSPDDISRGLFAGVSLEGSTLRPDNNANEKLYGKKLTVKEILREGKVGVPAAAHILDAELAKASPKNLSDPKSLQ